MVSAGRVHLRASLILSAAFGLGALVNLRLLECAAGSLAGVLLSPDLDVDAGNISNTIIKQRVGWFGERAWQQFWKGYSGSFKHGRFASHFPIFSTFIRLSYVYFWIVFLPHVIFAIIFPPAWDLDYVLMWYARISPLFIYGLMSSDLIHYFLDILTTEHKEDKGR